MRKVFPITPRFHVSNGCFGNIETPRYRSLGYAVFKHLKRLACLVISHSGIGVFVPTQRNSCIGASTLVNHVVHVLFVSSNPKMVGANTDAVIARMADFLVFRYRAIMQNPRCARGGLMFIADAAVKRSSFMATRASGSLTYPKPAAVSLFYALPKAFRERWRKVLRREIFRSNFDLHSSSNVCSVPRSRLQQQCEGTFISTLNPLLFQA